MEKIYIISGLIGICILGMLKIYNSIKNLQKRENFSSDFSGNFKEFITQFCDGNGINIEKYSWLIHKSDIMQEEMGYYGIIYYFKVPNSNQAVSNYLIILNAIPEIKYGLTYECHADKINSTVAKYIDTVQESFSRYSGNLDYSCDKFIKELRNPIHWFKEGIEMVLELPFYLLYTFGILSNKNKSKITSYSIIRFFSNIVSLIMFLSAIIGFIVGLEESYLKIIEFLKSFH